MDNNYDYAMEVVERVKRRLQTQIDNTISGITNSESEKAEEFKDD
jgi:hypothetical protein